MDMNIQHEIIINKFLPYASLLEEKSNNFLSQIKLGLLDSISSHDLQGSVIHWASQLNRYILFHGYKFSKSDHIAFVNLFLELILIPGLDYTLLSEFVAVLLKLLKKKRLLKPQDLTIDWRSLYELCRCVWKNTYCSERLHKVPIYFAITSTQEMLDEWRPLLCPFSSSMDNGLAFLEVFLPTLLDPKYHCMGFSLWFDELMTIWDCCCHNGPSWEKYLIGLFNRLAYDNIGFIDWEPYIPKIFTRILRSFDLPVGQAYEKTVAVSFRVDHAAEWIISMMGGRCTKTVMNNLKQLLCVTESFSYPSNYGIWSFVLEWLLSELAHNLVDRVYRERFKQSSWIIPIPTDYLLSDDDVTEFVSILKPRLFLMMFSKSEGCEIVVAFEKLAMLRPQLIIPPLLDRMYPAFETLIEPHRLTACLKCVAAICCPLVNSVDAYPLGRLHVIQLLNLCLPGIDPNDMSKCLNTFRVMAKLSSLVPLVDCTSLSIRESELSKEEVKLCQLTAQFKEFVTVYLDKVFYLIEKCDQPVTKGASNSSLSSADCSLRVNISSTTAGLLHGMSSQIFDLALTKLKTFIFGSVFDTHTCGLFAADLICAAIKAFPEKSLKVFVPYFCEIIKKHDIEDSLNNDESDMELLWSLKALAQIANCDCCEADFVPFMPEYVTVLSLTLHLKCLDASDLAAAILCNLLRTLGTIYPKEYRTCPYCWENPSLNIIPIKVWGSSVCMENLEIMWHIPSESERMSIAHLLETFLLPELKNMKLVVEGKTSWSRERRRQSLCIVNHCLSGSSYLLSQLPGKQLLISDCLLPDTYISLVTHPNGADNILNNDNLRLMMANTLHPFLAYILLNAEDDIRCLVLIIEIYKSILLHHGCWKANADTLQMNVKFLKAAYENKLVKGKRNLRGVLINIVMAQHCMRLADKTNRTFTETHQLIVEDLFKLAVSHYSEVRIEAQLVLGDVFKTFSGSHKMVLSEVVRILNDPRSAKHQLKGALYLIYGNSQCSHSLLHVTNSSNKNIHHKSWRVISSLWPALLHVPCIKDSSVDKAIDNLLGHLHLGAVPLRQIWTGDGYYAFVKNSKNNYLNVMTKAKLLFANECLVSKSHNLCGNYCNAAKVNKSYRDDENILLYNAVTNEIIKFLTDLSLKRPNSKFYMMALQMLSQLIRHDIMLPAIAIEIFLNDSVQDCLQYRQLALAAISLILRQQSLHHKKVEINPFDIPLISCQSAKNDIKPGSRPDNAWLQYDSNTAPGSQEAWNNCIFVNKTHWGYYTWPRSLKIHAPDQEQAVFANTSLSRNNEDIIKLKFSNNDFVNKLFGFLSVEEHRSCNNFCVDYFKLFKGIFRTYGLNMIPSLFLHLTNLVENTEHQTREYKQRCAAEIVSALIQSSKHWKYDMVQEMWKWVLPIIKVALSKLAVETIDDWCICFSLALYNQDVRKMGCLLETLMDNPLHCESSSFGDSSRLCILLAAISQIKWKGTEIHARIACYLEPFLTYQYKNVRDQVASIMAHIFQYDLRFPSNITPSLQLPNFLSNILIKYSDLMTISPNCVQVHVHENLMRQGAENFSSSDRPLSAPSGKQTNATSNYCVAEKVKCDSAIDKATKSNDTSLQLMDAPHLLSSSESVASSKSQVSNVHMEDFSIYASTEERAAVRLCRTALKMLQMTISQCFHCVASQMMDFLPIICQLERDSDDDELRKESSLVLHFIGQTTFSQSHIPSLLVSIQEVSQMNSWHARESLMKFCQILIFNNIFLFSNVETVNIVLKIVVERLEDEHIEVRDAAAATLAGLFQCQYFKVTPEILKQFGSMAKMALVKPDDDNSSSIYQNALRIRHAGILGFSSCILAHPYDIPAFLPALLVTFCSHLHDPHPIQTTVKSTMSSFKRTHQDCWHEHRNLFSDDQLIIINNLLISPNYYA